MKKISISNFIKIVKKEIPFIEIKNDLTFKDLTTFKIGGKIKCLIYIREVNCLLKVMKLIKQFNMPFFILGNGSNILADDKCFDKIVLKISLNDITKRKNKVVCGAGVNLFSLNHFLIKNSLSGLEWSYGIPGTVGGAVKMNAGSFGGEMKNVVESVFYTDGEKIFKKTNKSLGFSYRHSFFSNSNFVILKVVFNLEQKNCDVIEKLCFQNFDKRKDKQPYNYPSAGSVFKRPKDNFAPVLIESCGLKGLKSKNAEISSKHCGFIVNLNEKAKFKEVFSLINKIKKTVYKKFDIMLEEEIIILK